MASAVGAGEQHATCYQTSFWVADGDWWPIRGVSGSKGVL
jgi:hypothetical protein